MYSLYTDERGNTTPEQVDACATACALNQHCTRHQTRTMTQRILRLVWPGGAPSQAGVTP